MLTNGILPWIYIPFSNSLLTFLDFLHWDYVFLLNCITISDLLLLLLLLYSWGSGQAQHTSSTTGFCALPYHMSQPYSSTSSNRLRDVESASLNSNVSWTRDLAEEVASALRLSPLAKCRLFFYETFYRFWH